MVPAVQRLDEEKQRRIDDMWNNMLTPPHRLDRQLFLDVLVLHQLHAQGVDRLTLRSEKAYDAGNVVMEVSFDRSSPDADRLRVRVYDRRRKLVREECFAGEAVWRTVHELGRIVTASESDPPDVLAAKAARVKRITAATQPATRGDSVSD